MSDYKHISTTKKHFSERQIRRIYFFTGLMIGLAVAVIAYFSKATNQSQQSVALIEPQATKQAQPQKANTPPPIPKYDFYHILPQMKFTVPAQDEDTVPDHTNETNNALTAHTESTTQNQPTDKTVHTEPTIQSHPADKQEEKYIVQIASFKEPDKANMLKATLMLRGIQTHIKQVTIHDNEIRHQLRAGPYQSATDILLIRQQLAEHDLHPIVIQINNNK